MIKKPPHTKRRSPTPVCAGRVALAEIGSGVGLGSSATFAADRRQILHKLHTPIPTNNKGGNTKRTCQGLERFSTASAGFFGFT
jgi:hypothetical protein